MYYKNKYKLEKIFLILSFMALGFGGAKSLAEKKQDSIQISSGNENPSKRNHSEMNSAGLSETANPPSKTEGRQALAEDVKQSLVSVMEANSALHSAFFKYNGRAVEEKALKLQQAIEAVEDKEISKLLKFSKSKLSEIKSENNRKTNNKNYHLVSTALIYILNRYDLGSKYNAYSCPMVKKKWIQNSEKISKIQNPYAGNMPHCGSQDSHY